MPDTIIYEPAPGLYEAEHRGLYTPNPTAHTGVIIQGAISSDPYGNMVGGDWDVDWMKYDVRLMVGPYWKHVDSVVPKVTIDGYYSTNPDQDDLMRWGIYNLRWDTVGEFGPGQNEHQIRLRMEVEIMGEHARVSRLGYYVMASGRGLGEGGLSSPGPVKD